MFDLALRFEKINLTGRIHRALKYTRTGVQVTLYKGGPVALTVLPRDLISAKICFTDPPCIIIVSLILDEIEMSANAFKIVSF